MTNTDKIIRETYIVSSECRQTFNAKGEKVKAGKPYLLIETTRGKAILDIDILPEFLKDLAKFIPK